MFVHQTFVSTLQEQLFYTTYAQNVSKWNCCVLSSGKLSTCRAQRFTDNVHVIRLGSTCTMLLHYPFTCMDMESGTSVQFAIRRSIYPALFSYLSISQSTVTWGRGKGGTPPPPPPPGGRMYGRQKKRGWEAGIPRRQEPGESEENLTTFCYILQ